MFWSVSIKWTSSLFFFMFVLDSLNAHLVWTAQQQQMIDRIEWSEERNKQEQSWISEKKVSQGSILGTLLCSNIPLPLLI